MAKKPQGSHRAPKSQKSQKFSFFKVIDCLDEGVDDEASLVRQAIASGLRFSPDEAMELLYYDTGADEDIIAATDGQFSAAQLAEIEEFRAEGPLQEESLSEEPLSEEPL